MSKSLRALLASLDPSTTTRLAEQSEDVARLAVHRHPITGNDDLIRVWRWANWAVYHGAQHGHASPDRGIDAVAGYRNGRWLAIQVKIRRGGRSDITWDDLATFVGKSSRAPFTGRLLILLGDATLGSTARDELPPDVQVWTTAQIETAEGHEPWPGTHAQVRQLLDGPRPARPAPKRPREHQREAVADVLNRLKVTDRAQLVMACGTGKTITTHAVAQQLPSGRLLVLAPSLALLKQLIEAYGWQYRGRMRAIAVCSDGGVVRTSIDEEPVTAQDLPLPHRTSDPQELADFLQGSAGDVPTVVFSTYQSSPVVAAAQQRASTVFDLAVADEAHYLAGKPSPAFGTILDATKIRVTRRLFTTATPRLVSRHLTADDDTWASMDDQALFGPVAHRLTFGRAITRKLLTPYQLLLLGADPEHVDAIDRRALVDLGYGTVDAQTLAAALAVLRLIAERGAHRIITFHSRVIGARTFAMLLQRRAEWAPPDLAAVGLAAESVDGAMPTDKRAEAVARLAQGNACRAQVLSNARCLTAGIDVPTLDAVVFVDPKQSKPDVVQAVGRVLRLADGKDTGLVVVPVAVDVESDPGELVQRSAFERVWDVLAALADHDDDLHDLIEQARSELGHRGSTGSPPGRLVVDVPGVDADALTGAVWLRAVEQIGSTFAHHLGRLRAYVEQHGTTRVRSGHQDSDGFRLDLWVANRRTLHRKGRLPDEHVQALNAVGDWTWEPNEEDFQENLLLLQEWARSIGHARVPKDEIVEVGLGVDPVKLGVWVDSMRQDRRKGVMPTSRQEALDNIEGWAWDANQAKYDDSLAQLRAFAQRYGSTDVASAAGRPLRGWVYRQRREYEEGRLSQQRVDALEQTVPHWTWDAVQARFDAHVIALRAFAEEHDSLTRLTATTRYADLPLGAWVNTRRQEYRRGELARERAAVLTGLAELGWTWDPLGDQWQRNMQALQQYVARERNGRVPPEHVEYVAGGDAAGVRLGQWVEATRPRRSTLPPERRAALDALATRALWTWDARADDRQQALAAVVAYVTRERTTHVRTDWREDGIDVARHIARYRKEHSTSTLEPQIFAVLDPLPGWSWLDARSDRFLRGLHATQAHLARGGSCWAPRSLTTDDGFKLGQWMHTRRRDKAEGKLSPEHQAALNALDEWEWAAEP